MEDKEYLIQKTTLDGIANQSMTLIGKTGVVTTSEIISDLSDVNDEVDVQSALIDQLSAALEGKAGGKIAVETCTVRFYKDRLGGSYLSYNESVYYINKNLELDSLILQDVLDNGNELTIEVLKNSIMVCEKLLFQSSDDNITPLCIYNDDIISYYYAAYVMGNAEVSFI